MARLDLRAEAEGFLVALPETAPDPTERALAQNTWRGRMVNEHASARVFAGLLPQLMRAEVSASLQAEVAGMVQDELRHARQCAGALRALGGDPVGELPALTSVPDHEDADSPMEVVLRNVLSICCMSETVAVALIDAERRALADNPLAEVLRAILADEVKHARFGWRLLEDVELDDDLKARLSVYAGEALEHLEAHELAHLSPLPAPAGAQALGACDGALARTIFRDTVDEVIVPGLAAHGIHAQR